MSGKLPSKWPWDVHEDASRKSHIVNSGLLHALMTSYTSQIVVCERCFFYLLGYRFCLPPRSTTSTLSSSLLLFFFGLIALLLLHPVVFPRILVQHSVVVVVRHTSRRSLNHLGTWALVLLLASLKHTLVFCSRGMWLWKKTAKCEVNQNTVWSELYKTGRSLFRHVSWSPICQLKVKCD